MEKSISYYLNHKYFKQFNWYLFSGLMLFGAQFLMTSYIAKHNSLEEYSLYTLALSICSPIFLFFNMNSRVLIASNRDKYGFFHWRNFRVLTLMLALLICTTVGFIVLGPSGLLLILVLAGFRFFDGIYEWTYGFYVSDEKGDRVGRSQIFRSIALLLPIAVGLLFVELSIVQFYLLILMGLLMVFVIGDRIFLKSDYADRKSDESHTPKPSREISSILILALPLGFMALLDSLASQVPKYAFEYFGFSTMVGVFTSIFVFIQTTNYLGFSVVNSTMAALNGYYDKGNREAISNIITKSNLVMLVFSIGFSIGVYLLGEWVLRLFYTPEIARYSTEFFYVSFVSILMQCSLVYGFALFSFGAYRRVLWASLIVAITILVTSLILIPKFSLLGGILAFGLGQIVKVILYFSQYRSMISRLPVNQDIE